ncbi:Aldo/keto reductase subgroup [Penicillium expansum]|uniref:Aldo/keto reductase subgroup n=1 Tax=Penicillium expansum TaxID=27334 RepID=A0A0A2IDW5_PENEN|nr:Aldo/keto reductase subgroup [Penicillium expansum]KGO41267.1 Aldo/keto reductase subgroup [Penicillium expansum]KGO44138.1 Aldo/keto reductase subgroup [Penicillium expansum]KGO50507.1 Aldo/keto reductase subgroup [Penicillium expansum]
MAGIKIIWGAGSIMDEVSYPTLESINEVFDILQAKGITTLDTAKIYNNSEEQLGKLHAESRFTIDSKYPGGFSPEPSTPESFNTILNESLAHLQTNQLDVYYMHAPERRSSTEALLASINSAYQAGKFKRFGLSNYLAEEVEEVVRICREKNYVVPSVYQGNYSAVARRGETEIFPTLRKHNISFYAYSPIAGGFLTKDVATLVSGGKGRWDPNSPLGGIYNALFNKPDMLKGLEQWEKISKESGISKAELAYRWVAHNSTLKEELGDGLIIGSRNVEQLNQTLAALSKGPLSAEIAEKIEEVWKIVEADAPLDTFNSFPQNDKAA